MKTIELTEGVHKEVVLLARAWQLSEGEVVRRLLDEFAQNDHQATTLEVPDDVVPIYADYEGNHIEAIYRSATKRVDITSGTLKGRTYKSPSGAAIAVVRAHNPTVNPNRNGWSFWFLKENGQALQNIRNT